jgi:catecholate siderophore receptor
VVAGNRVQFVPYNQFAWWNKYQFTPMWAAAVGVIYFVAGRFDAGIYANIDKNWRAPLTIENIFNKGYWASADGNHNISPGQGRTIKLQASYRL